MKIKAEQQTYSETYYVGAYWGPRKESPEECAQRTAAFLELMAPCDPFLSHWFKPRRSRKDPKREPLMPPHLPTLTEAIRRGVNREPGGPAIEDLGFGFGFPNGGSEQDYSFVQLFCGGYAEGHSNSCVLSLPWKGSNAERVLTAPVLASVVRAMALAWEPDWAVAISHTHRDLLGKADVWLGWVTYLSRQRGVVPPLPAPTRVEPVEDKGSLIILTPERFTAANPEHVAQAQRVRDLLAKAGGMPV